jgi:hypothetical protein
VLRAPPPAGRKCLCSNDFYTIINFSTVTAVHTAPTALRVTDARDPSSTSHRSTFAVARKIRFFFVVL